MRLLDDIAVDHDIRGRGIRAGRLCRPPEPDFRVGVDRHALFKGKRGPLIGGRTVKRQFADLIGGAAAGILTVDHGKRQGGFRAVRRFQGQVAIQRQIEIPLGPLAAVIEIRFQELVADQSKSSARLRRSQRLDKALVADIADGGDISRLVHNQ